MRPWELHRASTFIPTASSSGQLIMVDQVPYLVIVEAGYSGTWGSCPRLPLVPSAFQSWHPALLWGAPSAPCTRGGTTGEGSQGAGPQEGTGGTMP